MYAEADQIHDILQAAEHVVIIQADNPDADSLGSALALESILGDMGKTPYLYCAVEMPTYLRYLEGWDRVDQQLPVRFDASIVVDASTMTLFERLEGTDSQRRLSQKPCIVLDHHEVVANPLPFQTVIINDASRASTGELIALVGRQLGWPMSAVVEEYMMTSILGDTQGLTNQLASAETYRLMADFIDDGVDRPSLEEKRREFGKMQPEIYKYKAMLIERTEFAHDNQVALVTIPQDEINKYSPLYNPGPLIQPDMLQTIGVRVAIVIKHYNDGRITGAIRCNPGAGIAAELAESLGGGGHAYASGFKVTDGRSLGNVKAACQQKALELLTKLEQAT